MRNELLNFLISQKENFLTTLKSFIVCVIFEISKNLKEKKEIFNHLCRDGINQYYIIWMWHGEIDKNQIATSHGY